MNEQNQIKNYIEPTKIYLVWKSNTGDHSNYIVGEVNKLPENKYELRYHYDSLDFQKAKESGFQGYHGFVLNEKPHSRNVMEAFEKRLPPRSRQDFKDYLRLHRLSNHPNISNFALLAYTEAKLPSDGFSFLHPFEGVKTGIDFLVEVVGTKYHLKKHELSLKAGDEVYFKLEPENEYDSNAIAVYFDDKKIGYINHCQTSLIKRLMNESEINVIVDRLNGTEERPRVFLYLNAK